MEMVNQAASGGTIPFVILAASETFPEPYLIKRYITFAERKKNASLNNKMNCSLSQFGHRMRAAYPHDFLDP